MHVKITYRLNEPDFELDELIEDKLSEVGFEFIGRGFDLKTGVRDITFEAPFLVGKQ